MNKKVAVLPGDGVGPEVVEQGVKVLKRIGEIYGQEFEVCEGLIGASAIENTGNPFPDETLALCNRSEAILFGAIGDPKYDYDPGAKVRPEQGLLKLRKELGLFANLRPVHVYAPLMDSSPLKKERIIGADLIVVRELIGGIYFGAKKRVGDKAIDTSEYSKKDIERVARVAFELAMRRKKKVTSVDKANVLETSRLWREVVNEVAQSYPRVRIEHMFVDNAAMQLIKRPAEFDVVLTENMFGDILTDEASVIAGSIGMLPSASIGKVKNQKSIRSTSSGQEVKNTSKKSKVNEVSYFGLYEPIHGAYNKAAGKNTANPIGTILSVAMMLRISFGMEKEAKAVENAVEKVVRDGWRTRDTAIKETASNKILGTREIGEKIVEKI